MAGMLFLTLWHLGRGSKRRSLWLVLSGVTIALSVMVKLFTGILVPIFLAGVTITAYQEQEKHNFAWRLLRPALIWGFAFAGMVLLILITLVGSTGVPFLIGSHLEARNLSSFQAPRYSINTFLEITMPFLGIIGALFTLQKRRWLTLYPLVWAMSAYLVLSQHTPIWYHHQLLITIPTTVLAAIGAGESLTWLIGLPRNRDLVSLPGGLSVFGLIAAVLVTTSLLPKAINQLDERPRLTGFVLTGTAPKLAVLNLMNAYAPDTHWVVTDMPMYAIRIQRPVPPNLATFSMKRLLTGDLTEDTVMENMRVYQPEQVLMVRFEIPALETYLQQNYRQVYDTEDLRLFIRNDLPEHQPAKQK
jgi:hypothetical protein